VSLDEGSQHIASRDMQAPLKDSILGGEGFPAAVCGVVNHSGYGVDPELEKLFLLPMLSGPFIHVARVRQLMQSCVRSSAAMSVDPLGSYQKNEGHRCQVRELPQEVHFLCLFLPSAIKVHP
jgi:hypothetical protein